MLVRIAAFYRLFVAAILCFFAAFPAFADQQCEPTEAFYNETAAKAIGKLREMSPKITEYNAHIKRAITDTSAPCYLLSTEINASDSKPYGWSGIDMSGATQTGKEYRDEIQNLMNGMDFSNVNMDFAPYEYKNSGRISAANIALKLKQTDEEAQKIRNDLLIFKQCSIELFNLQQEQSYINELKDDASSFLQTLSNPQTTTCTCDDSGTLKACSVATDAPEEESAKDLSCKNLNEYTQDTAFCPTCIIFERILMADQKLAGGAFGVLAGSLIKILSLAFLIYLAIQTLILVASPASQTLGKYLTSLAVQGFKVLVAVLILSNPSFLYDLALKPILESGLDFGITLTGGSQSDILAAGAKYTKFNTSDALLSAPFLQKMVGTADVFNTQAAFMPAMGRALICDAFYNLDWNIIPNIETMFEGFIVIIFGYIIALSVGFYLLDITLELGFICCLMPFLIACWPFKITFRYTKVGWNIFMHVFFNYVMLGVVITAINAISQRAIAPNHDMKQLVTALNTNDFPSIKAMMEIGGMQMILLIVCCYICLKLLKDVNNFANKLSGGAGFSISPGVGGLAASSIMATGINGGRSFLRGLAGGAQGIGAMGRTSGITGWGKEKAQQASSALGIDKVRNFASQTGGRMRNFMNRTKGKAGIGSQAIDRGGRHDYNSGTDFKTSDNKTEGGAS